VPKEFHQRDSKCAGIDPPWPRTRRPPSGPALAEEVDCSEPARKRLRIVLETIAGACSVEEACTALDVGPSRFHAMRTRFLRVRSAKPVFHAPEAVVTLAA